MSPLLDSTNVGGEVVRRAHLGLAQSEALAVGADERTDTGSTGSARCLPSVLPHPTSHTLVVARRSGFLARLSA